MMISALPLWLGTQINLCRDVSCIDVRQRNHRLPVWPEHNHLITNFTDFFASSVRNLPFASDIATHASVEVAIKLS